MLLITVSMKFRKREENNMNHMMRRKDKLLPQDEAIQIVEKADYGVLATVGEDGYPYGVPINYVFMDGKIYFHCAKGVGHKLENIRASEKVCFTVVGNTQLVPEAFSTNYESVVAFGTAKQATENKFDALVKLIEKYSPEHRENGVKYIERAIDKVSVIEVSIDKLTGKKATR